VTEIRHIFFDIGGVLGSNGWDKEQRQRAIERFDLDPDEFQWRHEEVIGEWEEGRITLDEYLDIAVFYMERPFSRKEIMDFMCSQSVPNEATIRLARALQADSRYTLMTLNNEAEELNIYRIEAFGISQIFEAFLSGSACESRSAGSTIAPSVSRTRSRQARFSSTIGSRISRLRGRWA